MLLKVRHNTHGDIVLRDSTSDGIRICGKVDPANAPADYFDYDSDQPKVVSIKKGDKGQVTKYNHMRNAGWVGVVFKSNDGTVVRGHIPINLLAISTTHLLEDWLSYYEQESYRNEHSLSPCSTSVTGPADCNPRVFTRVSVANAMDVYFGALSTVAEIIEISDAVGPNGVEIRSKTKLYYSKRSDRHSDNEHSLILTTPTGVGPPPGTQGHVIVEIMRHRTPHPHRYCTTGDLWMWSIEPYAKIVAFAFLYNTDGGWKKMYFRGQGLRLLDGGVRRSFDYIFIAMSFVMFLQRCAIPDNWRQLPWLPNYGIADVWNLSFKHLDGNQEYGAVRETRSTIVAPTFRVRYRPRHSLHAHLHSFGCPRILNACETEVMTHGWRSRNSCNLTQIKSALETLAAADNERLDDGKQVQNAYPGRLKRKPCDLCHIMGLDCAFERDIRLFTKNKVTDELTYAEALMRDLAPLHWHPDFDPNPIMDATFLGLATGTTARSE